MTEGVQLAVGVDVVLADPGAVAGRVGAPGDDLVEGRVHARLERATATAERAGLVRPRRVQDPARVGREPAEDVAATGAHRHREHPAAVAVQQQVGRQRAPDADQVLAVGGASEGSGELRRRRGGGAQWKESPQAQEPPALGLSIWKPCFSMVSAKSTVAPAR